MRSQKKESQKPEMCEAVNKLSASPIRRFLISLNKRSLVVVIATIFILCSAFIMTNDYVLVNTVSGSASFMTSDNLGNLYLVVNDELRKYDSDGKLLKTYSDKSLGSLAFVDANDPLTILLHYKDLRQLVFLDNMLSIKGSPITLDNLGVLQPTLVCNSYDNGFWIYDQQEFQLERFNKDLTISNQSGNIVQLTGINIKPNFLVETGGKVYLNDPDNGILVFDKFGTYSKILPFKNIASFQVLEEDLIYFKGSQLSQYNMKTFEEKSMDLPAKKILCARYEKNRLFLQDSVSVKIYSGK